MATRMIGDATFACETLPAIQGLNLLGRVMEALGPAAGILEAAIRGGADADVLRELARFVSSADKQAVESLILELAGLCTRDGAKAEPATLSELLRLAAFALEVQFGSFFEESLAGSILRGMGAERASA